MTDQAQRPFEMAYWLNNTFKNSGNGGKKLPEEIISHIDYDRYWRIEQGTWWHVLNTFGNNDGKTYRYVSAQGGIMLPAYNELVEYKDIIGLHDTTDDWWIRTPCAKNYDGSHADGNLSLIHIWQSSFYIQLALRTG